MLGKAGRIGVVVAAGLLMAPGVGVRAAGEPTPQCPGRIDTEQSGTPVEGWTAARLKSPAGWLMSVSFSEGPPANEVFLAPEETVTSELASEPLTYTNRWTFGPSAEGYWLTCHYMGTDIVLTRRLPEGLKSCETQFNAVSAPELVGETRCRW